MQWNMSDEEFCKLLDWLHPALAGIDPGQSAREAALAAARAIRRVTPRTLTVPAHQPAILRTWGSDYGDDVAYNRDLLERTVLDEAGRWQAGPEDYGQVNEQGLRHMLENRHQAMVLASRLFALTGERRYLGLCAGLMLAFVQEAPACPDGGEPAWASWMAGYTGMDVIRASHLMENWLLALPILQAHLADGDYLVFLKALACGADYHWRCWRHGFFHNYTRHGVRAAAGVGLALPMFKDSRQWLQLGIDRFFGDLMSPPHCLDDGYTRESVSYEQVNAYVATKWYLLCRTHGIDVPAEYERRLVAMFDWAARTLKPDGSHVVQGESYADSSHEHYILGHELLQVGAALFDRLDWRAAAGSLRDDRLAAEWLWIVEPTVYERWKAMPKTCLSQREMASGRGQSKFCTLRGGRGLDALCVQTWGLNARNHGHHDALHLEVYGLGRTLISDAGFASYSGDCRRKEWQPQRHSSVHLVGMEPAVKEFYRDDYTRQVLWHEDEAVAACGLESRLYLDYVIRRFVVLLKAGNAIAVVDAVWPERAAPMEPAVLRGIETRFAFHTPVMAVERDGLAVRSQHVVQAPALLHAATDAAMAGEGAKPFAWKDICGVLGWANSDANVVVRPVAGGDGLALAVQRDWVCVPGGIVPRPVAVYSYSGPLPYVRVWEVRPVRGLGRTEPVGMAAGVSGDDVLIESPSLRLRLSGVRCERPGLMTV